MCGIAGVINSKLSRHELEKVLRGLERDLHHRGPDDGGFHVSADGKAGLVNRRLAILDLSPAGHQPMHSADGRYTIVFNGEIYNYGALRAELLVDGYPLVSEGDTEVILALYQTEGAKCVERLEGMFAFAIWDDSEKSCFLARGPLGIKSLYYQIRDGVLLFASEIRALLGTGLVSRELSPEGIYGYLTTGSVPEPETLLRDVKMLPAGHSLTWRNGAALVGKFWDVQFGAQEMTYEKARERTRAALEESVARHLVSDVPVGVFLSGGIDSTVLAALASRKVTEPLRTFSISFDDKTFNEGDVAARTAAHFKTRHTDWRLDQGTARDLLQEFVDRSDQPSIDGFNTFCVSKMAHDHGLKVVLSGLGGDEVFGGYQSFQRVPQLLKASRRLGVLGPVRQGAGSLLHRSRSPRARRMGSFLGKTASMENAYACMRGVFTDEEARRLLPMFGINDDRIANGTRPIPSQPTLEDEVSYLELSRYMRNQLLRDSDVMSMAWSLELRVPFADRRLIEALASIPAGWRLARGKQLLLDAVPEIPASVRDRPKQGFTFPFEDWVTTQWQDVFGRIEESSPVPLGNWYRTWSLFALEKFKEKLR